MINKKMQVNVGVFALLVISLIGGTIFLFYERDSFNKIRSFLEQALKDSEDQRVKLKIAIGELQNQLKEKEEIITKVSEEKDKFRAEVEDLKLKLAKLQEFLDKSEVEKKLLQSKNAGLERDLVSLKEELRLWEGKITDQSEKKLVLERRVKSIQELRRRIIGLKVRARQEIDKIKLALGNQGYVIKEGKLTITKEKIVELEKVIVNRRVTD